MHWLVTLVRAGSSQLDDCRYLVNISSNDLRDADRDLDKSDHWAGQIPLVTDVSVACDHDGKPGHFGGADQLAIGKTCPSHVARIRDFMSSKGLARAKRNVLVE
jgi:hypothetical protein